MAVIGRRACPWCEFPHAHVRRNDGKLPYVHCPECGLGTQAKNGAQAKLLLEGMKPEPRPGHAEVLPAPGAADIVAAPPAPAEPKPEPPAPPAPKPKRQSWLSSLETLLDAPAKEKKS